MGIPAGWIVSIRKKFPELWETKYIFRLIKFTGDICRNISFNNAFLYFPKDIGAEDIKNERDAKIVTGPLEPRRDDLNSSHGVESVYIKLDLTKHSSRNKSRSKICVPSLRLNDLAIIES